MCIRDSTKTTAQRNPQVAIRHFPDDTLFIPAPPAPADIRFMERTGRVMQCPLPWETRDMIGLHLPSGLQPLCPPDDQFKMVALMETVAMGSSVRTVGRRQKALPSLHHAWIHVPATPAPTSITERDPVRHGQNSLPFLYCPIAQAGLR